MADSGDAREGDEDQQRGESEAVKRQLYRALSWVRISKFVNGKTCRVGLGGCQ